MKVGKNNSTCAICGKGYYMCRSCKDQLRLNPWKIHTDTSEHYKVFQILHGYTIGVYSKDEAKEKFEYVNLSDLETFIPNVKSVIETILAKKEHKENVVDKTTKTQIKRHGRTKTIKTEKL